MKFPSKLVALAAPVAMLTIAGCARDFNANVARFQRLPVPQGQTFRVEPANPAYRGGLEFGTYAGQVAQRLAQQGYRPVGPGQSANMIVQIDYGVGAPQQKVVTTPSGFCGGYGGFGYGGFGGYGYGGFGGYGGYGWRRGWGGFGGPFGGFGPGFGYGGFGGCPDVSSYTIFQSYLTMNITRSDGEKLFEGRSRAQSATDNLTYLVPNLIDAMFTGFPGNSGQDIRITVTEDQQKARGAAIPPRNGPYADRVN